MTVYSKDMEYLDCIYRFYSGWMQSFFFEVVRCAGV